MHAVLLRRVSRREPAEDGGGGQAAGRVDGALRAALQREVSAGRLDQRVLAEPVERVPRPVEHLDVRVAPHPRCEPTIRVLHVAHV